MATIKDIAEYTGYSPTTVSNVIHGRVGKMSAETKENIEAALKKFKYTSHMGGRLLAKNGSKIIGVIFQDNEAITQKKYNNPYLGEFLQAIETVIREMGYFMMFQRVASIDEGIQLVEMWDLEGVVLSGVNLTEIDGWIENSRVPIVFLDTYQNDNPKLLNVGLEDYQGSYAMAEYLINQGHKQIGFFANGESVADWTGVDAMRCNGVVDALTNQQLTPHLFAVPHAFDSYDLFLKNFVQDSKGDITACFFSSDLLAVRAMSVLHKLGYQVPNDFSIVSFDGTLLSQLATPQITTVYQDILLKAQSAIELLFNRLKNEELATTNVQLKTQLIVGESVKKIES